MVVVFCVIMLSFFLGLMSHGVNTITLLILFLSLCFIAIYLLSLSSKDNVDS